MSTDTETRRGDLVPPFFLELYGASARLEAKLDALREDIGEARDAVRGLDKRMKELEDNRQQLRGASASAALFGNWLIKAAVMLGAVGAWKDAVGKLFAR